MTTYTKRKKTNKHTITIKPCIYIPIIIILAVLFIFTMFDVAFNIEKYSSVERYSLLTKINMGDEEAIERYQHYIDKDEYLFNGPVTISLMAEKYGYDEVELYKTYINSDCETVQEFYEDYIK